MIITFTKWIQVFEAVRHACLQVLAESRRGDHPLGNIVFPDIARMVVTAIQQDATNRASEYPAWFPEMAKKLWDAKELSPDTLGSKIAKQIGGGFPRDPDAQQEIIQAALMDLIIALPRKIAERFKDETPDVQNLGGFIASQLVGRKAQLGWKSSDFRAQRQRVPTFTDVRKDKDVDFDQEPEIASVTPIGLSRRQWEDATTIVRNVHDEIKDEIEGIQRSRKRVKTQKLENLLPLLDRADAIMKQATKRMKFVDDGDEAEGELYGDNFYTNLMRAAFDDAVEMDPSDREHIKTWAGSTAGEGRSGSKYNKVKDIIATAVYLALEDEDDFKGRPRNMVDWMVRVHNGGRIKDEDESED